MILTLEIVSPRLAPGETARQTFRHEGGTIGRDPKNAMWVLSDPKVSGRHAVISYRESGFYIEDASRNGTFLNSKRLPRGQPHPLSAGDRLLIEPYEMRVSIDGAREAVPTPARAPVLPDSRRYADDDPFGSGVLGRSVLEPVAAPGEQPLDPLELLNLRATPPPRRAPAAADLQAGDPLEFAYRPPDAVPAPPANPVPLPPVGFVGPAGERNVTIPPNYNPLADESQVIRAPGAARSSGSSVRARVAPAAPAAPSASSPVLPSAAAPPPTPEPPTPPPVPLAPVLEHVALPVSPSPPPPPQSRPSPPSVAHPIELSDTGELRAFRSEESASFPRQRVVPASAPMPPLPTAPALEDRSTPGPSTGGGSPLDMAALLEGAGIDPALVTPELARQLGQILRVVVAGVMDVMKSRVDVKDEFGLKQTRFLPAENNPLKFSANVEDALHNLLVKRNPAYLGPVAAFESAFADLAQHELAMLAGIRTAFQAMLAAWQPDRLQEEFDRQAGKGLVPGKLRYWDQYRERLQAIAKDPETSFRRYFGDEFARAYEEQLQRLKTQRGRVDESDVSL